MDDTDIQETVESILGKGVKVVDCEKKSCVKEEEVLLVNGCPIKLEGEDGAAIREALLHGTVPHCDLLNQILVRAGILRAPVRLETSLSVKSSVVTREEVSVSRGGQIVDERSRETKEDNFYTSTTSEVWEPVAIVPNVDSRSKLDSTTSTSGFPQDYSSSSASSSRPNSDASTSAETPLFTSSSHVWRTPTSSTSSDPRCLSTSTSSSHSPEGLTDSDDQPDCNGLSKTFRGLALSGRDLHRHTRNCRLLNNSEVSIAHELHPFTRHYSIKLLKVINTNILLTKDYIINFRFRINIHRPIRRHPVDKHLRGIIISLTVINLDLATA